MSSESISSIAFFDNFSDQNWQLMHDVDPSVLVTVDFDYIDRKAASVNLRSTTFEKINRYLLVQRKMCQNVQCVYRYFR